MLRMLSRRRKRRKRTNRRRARSSTATTWQGGVTTITTTAHGFRTHVQGSSLVCKMSQQRGQQQRSIAAAHLTPQPAQSQTHPVVHRLVRATRHRIGRCPMVPPNSFNIQRFARGKVWIRSLSRRRRAWKVTNIRVVTGRRPVTWVWMDTLSVMVRRRTRVR